MGKKLKSIQKLDSLGLNHHVMCITRKLEEAVAFALAHPKGSVRTDFVSDSAYHLPFYVYETWDEFQSLLPLLKKDLVNGLELILSNGHAYDEDLRYNLVCFIDRSHQCKVEWSVKQVPLRHMYRYPNQLISLCGNVDDRLANWEVTNRELNAIDLREIYTRVQELFLIVDTKGLYGKHMELSVYRVPCGVYKEDMVFWEL